MSRSALFALAGVTLGIRSLQTFTNPNFQHPVTPADWFAVYSFSAGLLALAVAYPLFAQQVGGGAVFRGSLVATAGYWLSGVSNILEDGMGLDFAFWLFVGGALLSLAGLIVVSAAIMITARGRRRLLALVPAATLVGQITFPLGGGILVMLVWLWAAWALTGRSPATDATATPAPG